MAGVNPTQARFPDVRASAGPLRELLPEGLPPGGAARRLDPLHGPQAAGRGAQGIGLVHALRGRRRRPGGGQGDDPRSPSARRARLDPGSATPSGIGPGAGVRLGGLRVVGAHASSRTRSRSSTSRRDWMYRAPLPKTKLLSPCPARRFGGRLGVGERQISLDGWHGMVGHNWGAEHAERWIWLHGADRGRRVARRRDRQGEHRRR